MSKHSIVLHLDEPWYNALSRQLKKEDMTVEEKLDEYLDTLVNQLPERVYKKVSREVWEERQQHQAAETDQRVSVLRVTQDAQTEHLLTQGDRAMDMMCTAEHLRNYLLRKGSTVSLRYVQSLNNGEDITPEAFQDCADELRQGSGRTATVLDINLDRGEFSVLDAVDGWETYTIRDVCTAAWYAGRMSDGEREQQLDIFAEQLENKMIRCEEPEMEAAEAMTLPSEPTM